LNERKEPDGAWVWTFHSIAELRAALDESTTAQLKGEPPDGGDPDPNLRDRQYRVFAQNKAIAGGMIYLAAATPYGWNLIDRYYRKGFCHQMRGWIAVAATLGMHVPKCPGLVRCRIRGDDRNERPLCRAGRSCEALHEAFQAEVDLAVTALFFAIQRRQGRT
jgi:hypothetical protein